MAPWVAQNNVDVVIAGGMGAPAQEMVKAEGIKIIVGAPIETPEKLVLEYLNGTMKLATNSCGCGCNHH